MATLTTNLSLTKPEATDTSKIREDINGNSDLIDAQFADTYLAPQAKNAVSITGGSITGITDLAVADGGTGSSTAANARTALGLVIGTNVQAYDATLLSLALLGTAADKIAYTTNTDTWAETALTAFGRSIIDDANEATFKATVNLEIGTDVQAYDASLTSISALTYVSGSYIALTAEDTYSVRTYAQVLSDIGAANSGANSSITSLTGLTTPLAANYGGTGIANDAASTITITGAYTLGLTLSNTTALTLPTSGTLINSAVATLSSLTSIGTITTGGLGTGAVLAGVTMTLGSDAAFDTYYRGASVLTRLAPNTAASNKFLRMIGTGSAGQAPSWEVLGASDIPDISATYAVIAQTMYIGTTQVAINRASAALTLAGITLTTPDIGVATATSINKVTVTAPATSATLTLVTGSSLITAGAFAITLTSTAATGVTLPTEGTLYGTKADSITSAQLLSSVTNETGTGLLVFATAPTFTTSITTPIINLTGGQIAFPAAQAPSAGANTLDDYEEGAWTPVIAFGGASVDITYGNQGGTYTKIGRMVVINAFMQLSSKGTSTGIMSITGLPFVCAAGDGYNSCPLLKLTNVTFANAFQGFVAQGTYVIYIREVTEAGVETSLTNVDFADNSAVVVSVIYFTN